MAGRSLVAVGLVLATALAVAWASRGPVQATTFNPFLGPTDFYRLSSTSPGANADTIAQFNILEPSSNAAPAFTSVTFADADMSIANSAAIPGTGAYMGQMGMIQTMGIANFGCGSAVPVTFNFVEATTDTAARSITNNGMMTLPLSIGAGDTTFTYFHPLDPMGVRSDGMPLNEVQIDSEQMLITGVNTGSNIYTVVRGWNGTTPAAHTAGAEVKRVNVMYPAGPYWNLYENFVQDDGDLDNNGVPEFAMGAPQSLAGNMIADGADALPYFVRESLDPNRNAADGGAQQARARYAGVARNAAHVLQMFQIVVLDQGALAILPNFDWATAAWGYPVVTMYQDPLGPPSNDYGGSDLCNFTSNITLFGVPHDNACTGNPSPPVQCTGQDGDLIYMLAVDGGCPTTSFTNPNECGLAGQANGICPVTTCPRQTNPASAQTLRFYQYAVSQRDYDNDGHENKLDVCHSDPNPSWNPRTEFNGPAGDADSDGLPTPCDPNDAQNIEDEDGDGWVNRLESCPTIPDAAPGGGSGISPNTFMWDQDVPVGQDVPDGGPHADDIAPACDVAGESCAGCPALTPIGANGHYHATAAAQTICIGAATDDCSATLDADGDRVANAIDTCRDGANAPLRFPDAAPPGGPEPGAAIITTQNDADTITVDSTAGFTVGSPILIDSPNETLRYITSIVGNAVNFQPVIALASHGAGDPVAQVSFAQSMRDLNNDGFADVGDIGLLTGVFGSQGGDPANDGVGDSGVPGYQGRYDLNYNSFVDTGDVGLLTGVFGAACGPPP